MMNFNFDTDRQIDGHTLLLFELLSEPKNYIRRHSLIIFFSFISTIQLTFS